MGLIQEFKDFAIKGNAVDMAIGIVIGAAFGGVVNSLVKDIIMQPIGCLFGKPDFSGVVIPYGGKALFAIGSFFTVILNFLIVAGALFMVVQVMNRLKKAPPPADPATKACPKCCSMIAIKATRCPCCTSEIA